MSRAKTLLLPRIVLNRASDVPLHRQLRDQMALAIAGAASGTRLPSTRVLARVLGLSRNTVLAAYDDLAAEGLISGQRGAGMSVAPGHGLPPTLLSVRLLLREAGYPARAVDVEDADGNPVTLIY